MKPIVSELPFPVFSLLREDLDLRLVCLTITVHLPTGSHVIGSALGDITDLQVQGVKHTHEELVQQMLQLTGALFEELPAGLGAKLSADFATRITLEHAAYELLRERNVRSCA